MSELSEYILSECDNCGLRTELRIFGDVIAFCEQCWSSKVAGDIPFWDEYRILVCGSRNFSAGILTYKFGGK